MKTTLLHSLLAFAALAACKNGSSGSSSAKAVDNALAQPIQSGMQLSLGCQNAVENSEFQIILKPGGCAVSGKAFPGMSNLDRSNLTEVLSFIPGKTENDVWSDYLAVDETLGWVLTDTDGGRKPLFSMDGITAESSGYDPKSTFMQLQKDGNLVIYASNNIGAKIIATSRTTGNDQSYVYIDVKDYKIHLKNATKNDSNPSDVIITMYSNASNLNAGK